MAHNLKNTRGKFIKKNFNSFNKKLSLNKNQSKYKNKSSKRNYVDKDSNSDVESKRYRLNVPESEESEESESETVFSTFVTTFTRQSDLSKQTIQNSSDSEESEDDDDDEEEEVVTSENEKSEEEFNEEKLNLNLLKDDKNSKKCKDDIPGARKKKKSKLDLNEHESDEENINDESNVCTDPFVQHLHYELDENLLNAVQSSTVTQTDVNWPILGNITFQIPKTDEDNNTLISKPIILENKSYAKSGTIPNIIEFKPKTKLADIAVKSQIANNIKSANELVVDEIITDNKPLTDLQTELFSIINNYQDCYYAERNFKNGEQIRFIYTMHAVNHIIKTRTKILHHNAKLTNKSNIPDEYRDQGLVRPKILIIVPFQDSALRIVKNIIQILVPDDKGQVLNKNRFMDEFSGGELAMPKKNPKPDDYQKLFSGNTNDNFRIGISITKKSVKLYTEFYSSDIIIASPLGLRIIVGAPGETERDYDFLASIELLILDQTEQFLMQNWDHFLHIMNHLHLQPKDSHGTDFSRVRMWSINGWAKYYRQTLIFSAYPTPEINAFFNKQCVNYAGKAKISNPVQKGTICKIIVQVPQIFTRFQTKNIQDAVEARFDFFKNKILAQYKNSLMKHTLIYVPSYFDYVRIRNYFKQEEISFVQICEYSKDEKIARARDKFFHGESHFLLYSERFHHFRRIRLKGIRHIIFYQPPTVAHFYSELCNFMMESNQNLKSTDVSNMSVTVLYCKYDVIYLNSIIGTERTSHMFKSERNTHMFMTGE